MKPRKFMHAVGAGMVATMLATPAIAEDSARIAELERKLERSMQLIEQLTNKVQQLETQRPAASAPEQQARVENLERQIAQLGSGLSGAGRDTGLPLHGFADVGFGHSGENNPVFGKGRKGFTVGTLDLYLTPQFGERVRTLLELNFEVDREGSVNTDLERAQVGYAFGDAATGWMGRYHTPYGYWNTAFHHGAQIQTSLLRPRFLDFEDKGGILPAHTTGAWLTGSMPVAGNRVGYDLYLGNASALHVDGSAVPSTVSANNASAFNPQVAAGAYAGTGTLDMRMAGGTSHNYQSGFNAWIEPHQIEGLRIGLHGLRGRIEDDSVDANRTRLGMLGGYGVFANDRWEIMSEYYRFRNQDLSGSSGSHESWAAYLQAGYSLGRLTPYVRAERAQLDQRDNYFAVQQFGRSYRRVAAGLRYEVDPKAALKLEMDRTEQQDLGTANDGYNEARVQYSIRF